MTIDLRLLNAFVAVAETENVGKAAERLNISQSPLSRQIMQLEAQLGLSLFERVRQRVRLTDEGRQFLGEARGLLLRAGEVEAAARRLARGEAGLISVGHVEAAMHSGLLPAALARFRAAHPEVELLLVAAGSSAQADALERHDIDLGLVYSPPDSLDIVAREVLNEPLVLALPAAHPLATATGITAADLDGRPWIAMRRERNPARDRFLAACRTAGFVPDIQLEADDLFAMLALVAAGLGFAIVQQSLSRAFPADVVFRALPFLPLPVRLNAIWRRDDPKPLVAAFRRCLTSRRSAPEGDAVR